MERALRGCLESLEGQADERVWALEGLLLEACEQSAPRGPEELLLVVEEAVEDSGADHVQPALLVEQLLECKEVERELERNERRSLVVVGARVQARLPESGGGEYADASVVRVEQDGAEVVVRFDEFSLEQRVPAADVVLESERADFGVEEEGLCELCERKTPLTAHHVRPRQEHARLRKQGFAQAVLNETTMICRPCHSAVHRAEDNATLAAQYFSVELLREHPKVARYVAFARKQKVRRKKR